MYIYISLDTVCGCVEDDKIPGLEIVNRTKRSCCCCCCCLPSLCCCCGRSFISLSLSPSFSAITKHLRSLFDFPCPFLPPCTLS